MENIYEIYERLLKDKGLTNYKVSKDTGISQSLLSKWKVTGNPPKIETLGRLADYLGVSLDYLTGKYKNEPALYLAPGSNWKEILNNMTREELDEVDKYIQKLREGGAT